MPNSYSAVQRMSTGKISKLEFESEIRSEQIVGEEETLGRRFVQVSAS
jgi:hypothetical protein